MENKINIKEINEKIEKESAFIDLLLFELNKVIVGQKPMIERLLIGLLGKGHILIERLQKYNLLYLRLCKKSKLLLVTKPLY